MKLWNYILCYYLCVFKQSLYAFSWSICYLYAILKHLLFICFSWSICLLCYLCIISQYLFEVNFIFYMLFLKHLFVMLFVHYLVFANLKQLFSYFRCFFCKHLLFSTISNNALLHFSLWENAEKWYISFSRFIWDLNYCW